MMGQKIEEYAKTALVFGATGGIGREFCEVYASEGWHLIMADINEDALNTYNHELCEKYSITTSLLKLNLMDENFMDNVREHIVHNCLNVEAVVVASGVFSYQDVTLTPNTRLTSMFKIHCAATLDILDFFCRMFAKKHKGEIIVMNSMASDIPFPGIAMYCATKAFGDKLCRALHNEVYNQGVRVMSCSPGAIDTGLYGLKPNLRKLALFLRVSMTPKQLAEGAVKAVRRGTSRYTPGFINFIALPIVKHLPDPIVRFIDRKISRFKTDYSNK